MVKYTVITEIEPADKYLVKSSCEEYTLGEIRNTLGDCFVFFPEQYQNLSTPEMKEIVEFMEDLNNVD